MKRYERPTIYDHLEALRKFVHRLDTDLTPAQREHTERLVLIYTRLYVE